MVTRTHDKTRELPGERDNARNNARCTQARKARTTWMDNIKTWTGLSVEESIRMTRGQGQAEKVRPWCGQPSDRGRLKKRTGRRKYWAKRHKLARLGHAATTRGTCGTTYVRLCPVITVQNKYYTADQNKTKRTGHTVT